jgi:hyperosmotically inducible periplasmic protein
MNIFKIMSMSAFFMVIASVGGLATDAYANKKTTANNVKANNTKVNERDQSVTEVTAQDQGNSTRDIELTSNIRREVVKQSTFSTDAQNIKIISIDGVVTLKGPVKTVAEKAQIEKIAAKYAGAAKVQNQIEVVAQ